MRFTAAVVLASAAVASASIQSTAYETELVTITACPPTVPDCPAKDQTTSISTSYYPVPTVSTVDYPVPTVTEGVPEVPSSVVVPPSSVYQNSTISATVPGTLPVVPTGGVPVCPSSSVVAVTKSYTTVLTSVEYSTVEVPCPTTVPAVPTLPLLLLLLLLPLLPATPRNIVTPPPVNGAGSMTGSALFAAAAGLVAVYLA
ncbi:hypothetical protein B0I35DRAFT_473978 [Stachybotrys elegans]|uniref:GPI anchored serine-rich protein n=1 Tax=Stachybotrys elegans TaxID=80388 RepID=A0A8K0T5U8_9HYPO|nr:hypothetical protein B0I35DRAFT_473978 [Stachybotrys elegans]